MPKPPRDIGASVRARLQNFARDSRQPFDLVLTRYVLERLLYRLSLSKHRNHFVLKGAMLIATWLDEPFRPTRDLDLLGYGDPDAEAVLGAFREICAVAVDDGVIFDAAALEIGPIREVTEYGGLRLKTNAVVAGARVRVVVDIGFGDATEPGLVETELPTLLDQPAPHLRAYAPETVIAEKFQAMVMLGRANTRMKDFYDIWRLSRSQVFKGDRLARAIAATFARRNTPIPQDLPDALTPSFAADPAKRQAWRSFLETGGLSAVSLDKLILDLAAFLMRHAKAAGQR